MVTKNGHSAHALHLVSDKIAEDSSASRLLSFFFTLGCTAGPSKGEGEGDGGQLSEPHGDGVEFVKPGDDEVSVAVAFKSARLNVIVPAPERIPRGTTSIASSLLQMLHAVSLSPKYGSPPK